MSFLPTDLDQQAKALPSDLMAQQLPAQSNPARTFSDPSYLMEINAIRAKVAAGTATQEDMRQAIKLIRETRGAVSAPASKPKRASASSSKAKPAKPDGQALLDLL